MSCVILLLMRNMVSFQKVWCGSLTLTHEALFLIPFLFNCPRCIVVLHVFVTECAIRIDKQQKERYNNVVIDNDVII